MRVFRKLMEQESIRGERTAWIFRWILYGLVFFLALMVYLGQGRVVGLFGVMLSISLLLYNTLLTWFINRKKNHRWIRYASVSLDVVGLTLYNTLDTVFTSPLVPVTTAALLLYPVILFLASLRLDRKLIVYGTLLSLLGMNLLFFGAWPFFDQDLASRVVSADVPGQLYRSVYVALCGFLMLFVPDMVTRLLMNQQEIHHKSRANYELAHRDKLTGLANRLRLEDFLPEELLRAGMENRKVGVIYVDLDEFKPINDEHGHETGDLVLKETGRRLSAAVRGSDLAVRVGGDEFVIVLSRIDNREMCESLAERIMQGLAEEIVVAEKKVRVGASHGVAVFPEDGLRAAELVECADRVMLSRKKGKR